MKKIKLEKKDKIYISIISLLTVAIVLLSVALFVANQRKSTWNMSEYYKDKVISFGVQNANLSQGQIVFIGDSITDLCPLDNYYADLDLACYNRGIGGDITLGVIDRLKVSVFDLNPSKIVLMIGTNDVNFGYSYEDIIQNYRNLLDEISKNQPMVDMYVMSIIPQNKDLEISNNFNVTKNNETIRNLNVDIRKMCEEYGYTFVDIFHSLIDENGYLKKDYSDDGLHLNSSGFEVWASLIKPYLEK